MRRTMILAALLAVACGTESEKGQTNGGDAGGMAATDAGTTDDLGGDDATTPGFEDAGAPDLGSPDVGDVPVDTSPLDVMDRPASVFVPDDYDAETAYPLVVLLHGYGADSRLQNYYFGTSDRVTDKQFVLVTPDGTKNPAGQRHWNAYWCCDFYGENVDDVGYVTGLIEAAKERYNIDADRVYLIGHSNGGFMSYRMACDVEQITAIASLAGSGPEQQVDCVGAGNTSILQIHGTLDDTISYEGSVGEYPGAEEMVRRWAERNGCDETPTADGTGDYFTSPAGNDTTREAWSNCDGGSVALWTIEGGGHIPTPRDDFRDALLDYLLAQ